MRKFITLTNKMTIVYRNVWTWLSTDLNRID